MFLPLSLSLFFLLASSISSICLLGVAAAKGQQPLPPPVDVFVAGEGGYACYRIPAILVLSSTRLLAFSEGRLYNCGDAGHVNIVARLSTDSGLTWGPVELVHGESTPRENVTIGNPAPVLLQNGTIALPFCRNNSQVGLLFSDDGGSTWRLSPVALPVPANWSWVATGPPASLLLALPGGGARIIVPANHIVGGAAFGHAFLSDDGGASWTTSAPVPGGNEDQAVALPWLGPSALLLSMRTQHENFRTAALSQDGGHTWSAPWETISEGQCEGSIAALPKAPKTPLLVQSSPFSLTARQNLTLHVSQDGQGRVWTPLLQLYPGGAAYSALAVLGDSTVGVLFERDGYKAIAYMAPIDVAAALERERQ